MNKTKSGITAPKGFSATGAHIGLKKKKKDLALIWSAVPATAAAVFTTNVVKAAPILWNQKVIEKQTNVQGIVINSGNANACTGKIGIVHAETMAQTFATCKGTKADEIFVASTGIIGLPLPIECLKEGIKTTYTELGDNDESGKAAAEAIMTTDLTSKEFSVSIEISGKTVTFGGMAKGSGMIHPNMATMLAFITTDACISGPILQKCLLKSVQQTYNMISVDGDTSTNDMVLVLANGLAENKPITDENSDDYKKFSAALNEVNTYLAKAIVNDGEGATKLLEVTVQGANNVEDAQKLSKSVISSNLVKAAFYGEDANWGRIIVALGYGGVPFDPNRVSINFASNAGQISLMNAGEPAVVDESNAAKILKERDIRVLIDLDSGNSSATAWGCDLSYEYVRINGSYRS